MTSQISEQPLAELIREISLERQTGTLRLQHVRAKVVVYFEEGQLVYAASNLRDLRLKTYLQKQDLVSEKQLATLGRQGSDLELAAALCANGLLDRKTTDSLIANQVRDILRVALLWTEGTSSFDERSRLGDSMRVKLDMTMLLVESARRMPLQFVSSRFPNPDELISPLAGAPDFNGLLPTEGFVLSRVEQAMRLGDLVILSSLREADAYRAIYSLALSGFVKREHWQGGIRRQPKSVSVLPPPVQDELVEQTAEDDLDQFFARLSNATSYYQVLNVEATAEADDIKGAYYGVARRYHPDRFRQSATALHARVESAFARVTQAYETLTDPAQRSAYDSKLSAKEKARQFAQSTPKSKAKDVPATRDQAETVSAAVETQQAEDNFREGFAALQQGLTNTAITYLAAAARAFPQDARYRAYYGLALAGRDQQTRRLAEAEIQAAIKLDPANSSYRVMLAQLYFDLGFHRRAQTEATRVLTAEPDNSDAQALLRRLEVK